MSVQSATGGKVHAGSEHRTGPLCRPGTYSGLGLTGRKAPAWKQSTKDVDCKACIKLLAEPEAAAPAEPEAPAPAAAPIPPVEIGDGLHRHCTKCGWDFGKLITQALCGSPKMCAKRVQLGDPNYGRRTPRAAAA